MAPLLGLLALGLAAAIVYFSVLPGRAAIPSRFRPLPESPNIRFERTEVATDEGILPRVTNVQVLDFDNDGRNDLLVCDATRQALLCYRRDDAGQWSEQVVARDLPFPAHATVVDLDQDGDTDVIVSLLGAIRPSDHVIGRVMLLERDGESYREHVLLDDVRRVADVQPGDFDGDGDLDLAVAVFGYERGEVLWLENRGEFRFADHQLLFRPGTIHVPVGDLDGDGDLDIAAIVTQHEEELWAFENLGNGKFRRRRLHYNNNYDVGGAGLLLRDLDQDGDLDFILPEGDNLEDVYTRPQPYHGCKWVENQGGWKFRVHQIAHFGETYAADTGDLDGDGDLDLVLVSMSSDLDDPNQATIVWLENDGRQNFKPWKVDGQPFKLATVACGDLNGDGRADLVAGSIHLAFESPEPRRRITVWFNN